ncbi:beta-lactamase family protein [Streptomyces sp. SID11233]|nr:beta-lactamase family protein [Streptomyces sp. SID11233]
MLAAALLVASALAPVTAFTAPAVQAAGTACHHRADCRPGGLGPALTARLDRPIADVREQAGIPGAVVGLWMQGRGSYVRAGGTADTATGKPMAADSFVRIGSETKTFTVTALLELVDAHRIGLDDPIARYVHGVPGGRRITLRQLAEMRSGLFPYTSDPDFVHALLSDPLFPKGAEFPEPHPHGYTDQTLSGDTGEARRQRLRTLPTGFPGTGYGLGIFETNGWIGHNGSIPGYETVTVCLPSQKATPVIMINTDSRRDGQEPSTVLARAITGIVTPDNLYDGAVVTR